MQRRQLLKASLGLAAYTGLPIGLLSAPRLWAAAANGEAEPFDFSHLRHRAQQMAQQPYHSSRQRLPVALAQMTPQQFNAIQYDPQHALWREPKGQLDVQFFHVGMGFRQPVRMYDVDAQLGLAREVHFRPELFNYEHSGVDASELNGDLGFAGLKVFQAPHLQQFDILSFLGASYFRAVDSTRQYGLSARGLAIDTFAGHPEEFPDFTHFWLVRPAPDSDRFTLYALLDSPSASGAYAFHIHCQGDKVVMDLDVHLYTRKAIKQLGIAPMTSMFACGTHERRMCDTIHPEIHDSDRLVMWRGNGEWVCRPLNNPAQLQFNSFSDDNPKGFGLVQSNHDFRSYQDMVDFYHRRPSLWVEPTTEWGQGAIALMEIPTTGETLDNIVAFWNPAEPVKAGMVLHFGYRLHWSALPPVAPSLAQVHATRSGMGGFTEGWAPGEHYPEVWARRFAVDFTGEVLEQLPADGGIEPVLSVSHGEAKDFHVLVLPEPKGYRILFDWYPEDGRTAPVDMRLFIRSGDQVLSETWLYQYFPPAPEQRNYPQWPQSNLRAFPS